MGLLEMDENTVDSFWHGLCRVKRYDFVAGQLPDYLYEASTDKGPFVDIMLDMAKLNNYILGIRGINNWNDDNDPTAEDVIDRYFEEFDDEADRRMHIYFADEYAIEMEEFVHFAEAASSLVMLYFFFIKSLKDVCHWVEPALYEKYIKSGEFKINEIGAIINILDKNTSGEVSKNHYKKRIKIIMENVKQIRNYYAHGDWQRVRREIRSIRMKTAMQGSAEFLSGLEGVVSVNKNDPIVKSRIIV